MDPNLKKALDECSVIERRIKTDQSRLSSLKEYVRLHQTLWGQSGEAPPVPPVQVVQVATKRDRVLNGVDTLLADGTRRTTRELLRLLKGQGIDVGGADEVLNLSGYLSREKKRYSSDRRLGWGLVGRVDKASSDGAATPSELFS